MFLLIVKLLEKNETQLKIVNKNLLFINNRIILII